MSTAGKNSKSSRRNAHAKPAAAKPVQGVPPKMLGSKRQAYRQAQAEDRNRDYEDETPERRVWRAGTMLAPVPVVLVSCGGAEGYQPNLITLAWAGTVNSEPPMLSVSIRPSRYSHEIISKTREFVVNLTTAALARSTDWCGVRSGREVDKFASCHLTAIPSMQVSAPTLAESPLSLE